jgi:hypothetical protein
MQWDAMGIIPQKQEIVSGMMDRGMGKNHDVAFVFLCVAAFFAFAFKAPGPAV